MWNCCSGTSLLKHWHGAVGWAVVRGDASTCFVCLFYILISFTLLFFTFYYYLYILSPACLFIFLSLTTLHLCPFSLSLSSSSSSLRQRERRSEIDVGPAHTETSSWLNWSDRSATEHLLCQTAGPLWMEIISKLLQKADACQKMLSVKVIVLQCCLAFVAFFALSRFRFLHHFKFIYPLCFYFLPFLSLLQMFFVIPHCSFILCSCLSCRVLFP